MASGEIVVPAPGARLHGVLAPTLLTRIGLWSVGLVLGEIAWRLLSGNAIGMAGAGASMLAGLCAAFIWGLRDKVDFSGGEGDERTLARRHAKARELRLRAILLAARAGVLALVAGVPSVSKPMLDDLWHWMPLVSGVAVGEAVFLFLVALFWQDQLQAHRDRTSERKRRDEENTRLRRKLQDA